VLIPTAVNKGSLDYGGVINKYRDDNFTTRNKVSGEYEPRKENLLIATLKKRRKKKTRRRKRGKYSNERGNRENYKKGQERRT